MNIVNLALTISLALFGITLIKQCLYLFSACLFSIKKLAIHRKSNKYSQKQLENWYKVSVVIPAWNEEVGVISTIKSILNSDYGSVEIIVVNDGSTDKSAQKIEKFIKTKFKSHRKKYKGKK